MTFVAGTVLTAAALNSELAAKSDTAPAINAQTGTTYTFSLADATAGKTITASNAAASTYTVPPQSSVTFVAGALLRVTNLGAGVVTFAGGVGVTVTNTAATLAQYQTATLVRTGSDAWTVTASAQGGLSLIASGSVTAGSALSINNCFSAQYDNYLMMIKSDKASTFRFRLSGTDNTAANFYGQYIQGNSTTVSGARVSAATSADFGQPGHTISDVLGPFLALPTYVRHSNIYGTTSVVKTEWNTYHSASTSFDGFSILGSVMTASVKVYGYQQ